VDIDRVCNVVCIDDHEIDFLELSVKDWGVPLLLVIGRLKVTIICPFILRLILYFLIKIVALARNLAAVKLEVKGGNSYRFVFLGASNVRAY
jgi:hypothetical protein